VQIDVCAVTIGEVSTCARRGNIVHGLPFHTDQLQIAAEVARVQPRYG
jgi:hypothetical protein